MHQQRSKATLFGLRLRAYLFILSILSTVMSIGLLAAGTLVSNDTIFQYGAYTFISAVIISLIFMIISFSWKCPLCVGAVWKMTPYHKNKNAKKALGISYRLGVAFAVIFRRPYRCPYCGEKFSSSKTRS